MPDSTESITDSRQFRRQWLKQSGTWIAGLGVGGLGMAGSVGCPSPTPPELTVSPRRSDVPLRVTWMGRASDAEVLTRFWGSVSELPIDLRRIDSPRYDGDDAGEATFAAARQSDVIVFPLIQLGEMTSRELLMPLPSLNSSGDEEDRKSLPAALRVAITLGDQKRAMPLGGYLPAILIGEKSQGLSITSWADIDKIATDTPGQFVFPTAPMWAGWTYLAFASAMIQTSWLLDRETLAPLIDQPEYVEVLRRMRQWTVTDRSALTPTQVWKAIESGDRLAGIGFPDSSGATTGPTLDVQSLPRSNSLDSADGDEGRLESLPRQMFDPFMLIASLSSSCRQTNAAASFLRWLSSADGSASLSRSIPECLHVPTNASSNDSAADYWSWWKRSVETPNVVPSLQLQSGIRYYEVLDTKVRECLGGAINPETACQEVVDAWTKLHKQVGLADQKRTWQRAMGLS